jgi:hypothetical protein
MAHVSRKAVRPYVGVFREALGLGRSLSGHLPACMAQGEARAKFSQGATYLTRHHCRIFGVVAVLRDDPYSRQSPWAKLFTRDEARPIAVAGELNQPVGNVYLPWSIWAMIAKLRMFSMGTTLIAAQITLASASDGGSQTEAERAKSAVKRGSSPAARQ